MTKRDIIEFIPIGALSILGVYSIIEVLTTDYVFNAGQFVGLTLLGVSLVLFFANRRIYKYLFGGTLLLGLFNLIGFTTTILSVNFIGIPIQILVVPILITFVWINEKQIGPKLNSLFRTTEEQAQSESNSKVEGFKRRFENLSDEEIRSKLNEKLVPEALEALKQIQINRTEMNYEP